MPELPEVEIHARRLARYAGATLRAVTVHDARALVEGAAGLNEVVGSVLGSPWRRGKHLVWPAGPACFLLHLRMTGSLEEDEAGSFRLSWHTDRGVVGLHDPRCLAEVRLLPAGVVEGRLAGIGPEFWPGARTGAWWQERLGHLSTPIKVALLRQDRVAGVGNILATEACFRAGVDVRRPARSLAVSEWESLGRALAEHVDAVLADAGAYVSGELSFAAGQGAYVSRGGTNPFLVYGRAGEPCPACGGSLARLVQQGRGTTWCPRCQT